MSSKNRRKEISLRPSLIPRRKISSNTSSQDHAPAPKPIGKEKGKNRESFRPNVQTQLFQSKKTLQSEYLDIIKNDKLQKAHVKKDLTAIDPSPLQLPPPTKEFYDASFLDFVSGIINNNQEEEYKINTDIDGQNSEIYNESRVEKPRREATPAKKVLESNLPFESSIALLEVSNEEQLVEFEMDFDSIVIDSAREEKKECTDLKSIESFDLFNAENNTVKNNTSEDLVQSTEFQKSPSDNDFSWLCFDSKDEFVRFKDDCVKKGFGTLVEESNANDSLFEIERFLTEGGYMSPIQVEKKNPAYYKPVPDINKTSGDEIEKGVDITSQNKDVGAQNKSDPISKKTKYNDKKKEIISRANVEENLIDNYKDNSSRLNIEKDILRSSTPKKVVNVISDRMLGQNVLPGDTVDYNADCRKSLLPACKKKPLKVKEENDKSILRRTPPLITFPPRKRRTY